MGNNSEGNYIAEGMGKGYINYDDNNDDNNNDILGPSTINGEMPLDLEAPMTPLPIAMSYNNDNIDNNMMANTTNTSYGSSNDEIVSMDILKEFDRDYMKLRGRLITLIEKQSSSTPMRN